LKDVRTFLKKGVMKTIPKRFRPETLLFILWMLIAVVGFAARSDGGDTSPDTSSDSWRQLPIRSQAEHLAGKMGGEGEQHPHSIARSPSNPDIIYFSHDCSGVWKSTDAGDTWQKCPDKGLHLRWCQSIEVDPVNPDIVFVVADNLKNWLAEKLQGLYRSLDGGETWTRVLDAATGYNNSAHRIYRHNIAYDPGSVSNGKALRWYWATPNGALFRSDNGGDTWASADTLTNEDIVYGAWCHPADTNTVYVGTDNGLYVSTAKGASLTSLGDLPAGDVSSVAVHPQTPSTIYATVLNDGLYRSTNSGGAFTRIRQFDASRVFMNPGYPDTLYLVGISSNTIITHNAGQTWNEDMETKPLSWRDTNWKSRIAGQLSGIVPNPDNANEAVAFSRATIWKTTDGGNVFADSSTLFTGFAAGGGLTPICFDTLDSNRIALFNYDVGMTITDNGGRYFDHRNGQAYDWVKQGLIPHTSAIAGSIQPVADSQIIVASVGYWGATQLMRSTDEGSNWTLVTSGAANEHAHSYVSFHPTNTNIVYAGNKISTDAGQRFSDIDFGAYAKYSPEIVGMCQTSPDTIYAMDEDRYRILRSTDRGANWSLYAQPGWRFMVLDSLPTFTADPNDATKIYTIDTNGDFTVFNGSSWSGGSVIDLAGGADQHNFVRTIAVDPNNSDIIYAGTFASGHRCVFRSLDGGTTWEDITGNLPRNGTITLFVNPHTRELYKGSYTGTWIYPAPYYIQCPKNFHMIASG
jgi:photosystem II stability/assembly factor-like uncharacterized protein